MPQNVFRDTGVVDHKAALDEALPEPRGSGLWKAARGLLIIGTYTVGVLAGAFSVGSMGLMHPEYAAAGLMFMASAGLVGHALDSNADREGQRALESFRVANLKIKTT